MADRSVDTSVRIRLQRLSKGALFVGIVAGYALLLALTLILFGWRPALLAGLVVVVGQCFRHLAHDVERVGLTMSREEEASAPDDAAGPGTRRYQVRMFRLFAALTQLPNVVLLGQAFVLDGAG